MATKARSSSKPVDVPSAKPRMRKPKSAPVAAAAVSAPAQDATAASSPSPDAAPITGRGVFAVRLLGQAVSVEAAFLAQDGNVLRLPAVFPNREYALEQIDQLRQLVIRHFDELSAQANS